MSQPIFESEFQRTKAEQARAADPLACVWVSANAGTGKTHVLTQRVLRLLLNGTAPERILCITYTKAAAAEMSKRLFDTLAKWVTLDSPALKNELEKLTGRAPDVALLARARTLFTSAIETPGGLKVQTIHAFCERLLQRFPLEAGVTPSFTILDEDMTRKLRREAINDVLSEAAAYPSGALGSALKISVTYAADAQFDEILTDAMSFHAWLDTAERLEPAKPRGPAGLDRVEQLFRQTFNIERARTVDAIVSDVRRLFPAAMLTRIRTAMEGGTKQDIGLSRVVAHAESVAGVDFVAALKPLFLKSDGGERDKFLTKALAAACPDVDEFLKRVQAEFLRLATELQAEQVVAATMALHRLASAALQHYTDKKAQRAALDFDDLIARTQRLLATNSSSEWVMFKLDNGLDHILVDESQDTSPAQWDIVGALAREFFSSSGAGDRLRTVFAVGDEKQSIYSFQGAAPGMFKSIGDQFEVSANQAGLAWRRVPLEMSFRTVDAVLKAVDGVFANPDRTPGLMSSAKSIRHIPYRQGHAGLVEIWPPETYSAAIETDAWSPLDETPVELPAIRLAKRIAVTIKTWLETGEKLASENRAIREGDILILVQKRNPFAGPMVAALKALDIAVAGTDRIELTEQIAVQDLMSLGAILTVPDDDLALAEVLKSPIFGLDDTDLLHICWQRKGTLWRALLKAADEPGATGARFKPAATQLKAWRKIADYMPPFEFFASILDKDGVRKKLLSRLGHEASDPLDEFLNLALRYDDTAPPSLSGFLSWLRDGSRQIKRDMEHGRNEVRVMTVHGAKGLEAQIVFLPDTCSTRAGQNKGGKPMAFTALSRPIGAPPALIWPIAGATKLDPVAEARAELAQADAEESDRLLYVAMTRARDRLYVAGFENKNGRAKGCWYDTIVEGLDGSLANVDRGDGVLVRRIASPQIVPPDEKAAAVDASAGVAALPAWIDELAPREPQLAVPLAPSRLAPYEAGDEGDPLPSDRPKSPLDEPRPSPPQKSGGAGDTRFLRGTLTHALLEHLPNFSKSRRRDAANAFVAVRGAALPGRIRSNIVAETLAILDHPEFGVLFGPESRAEVPITAELPRPKGSRGLPLKLTGQIDRLAVTNGAVLIIDYKTNRMAPSNFNEISEVYLYQLAAYTLALKGIFPEKAVRAALLWTESATLMEIPPAMLDSYATKLWQLDPAALDG